MKHLRILFVVFLAFLTWSCATVGPPAKQEPLNLLHIDGIVQSQSGNTVTLQMNMPELRKTPGSPIGEIAQELVQKSLVIDGMKTEINGKPGVIKEVRGHAVIVELDKPGTYPAGALVRLTIPKKNIAITDFEVIRGKEKSLGRVTLEGMTTSLIDSGQFNVVERSKLKAVMNELELSRSGLTREKPEEILGKMMIADLILTGTLAESRGEWEINLRLVNVRTSQATAAIYMKTRLFKDVEIRDSGPLKEDFESTAIEPSWIMVNTGRTAPFFRSQIDRTEGSDTSKRSMRVDYQLVRGQNPGWARIDNRKKRDLSLYDGIEFYARATGNFHAQVMLMTSLPNDQNRVDAWHGFFEVDQTWEKIRIPFANMMIARGWIKEGAAAMYGAKPGDQVMRLDHVEGFQIGIHRSQNGDSKGSLWIDKIQFYND
ncbi:MAG: FlgO family outer membrane protein [Syntrophales bacterium]